jgi:Flp pilus assembly secretin CpaC
MGGGFVGGLIGAAASALGFGGQEQARVAGRIAAAGPRATAAPTPDRGGRERAPLPRPSLDASEIEVKVSGGEVTLSGTVNSRMDKRRAEDIVEDVSGVKHVQNNIRVQESSGGSYGLLGGSSSGSSWARRRGRALLGQSLGGSSGSR